MAGWISPGGLGRALGDLLQAPSAWGVRYPCALVANATPGWTELLCRDIVVPEEPKGAGMEDLRARNESNVGEQDLKFALTGIGICVVIALALMIFG
jgi:hypothetical protein